MELFEVVKIDEAYNKMKEAFSEIKLKTENVYLMDSINRVCAKDVVSAINVPHFNRSTVDGYGVKSEDIYGTSESMPMILELVGKSEMGKRNNQKINFEQCMYIPTGGMIPEGVDSVVMIEYAENFDQNSIAIYKPTVKKENIISIGDDVKKEQIVLKRGQLILPKDVGVLAAIGQKKVEVISLPKVALISTGDEIVREVEMMDEGKILDINSYTITGLIHASGAKLICTEHYPDDYNGLKNGVLKAMNDADIVIVSGGSSMGEKDNTAKIFNELGKPGVFIHGLSIKPGKPTVVALAKGKPLIGLPGQPVSAMIAYLVIVDWILKEIYSSKGLVQKSAMARLDRNVVSSPGKETYLMMKHYYADNNVLSITPVYGKSGMIQLIASSTGYIIIPSDIEGYKSNETVEFHYFA